MRGQPRAQVQTVCMQPRRRGRCQIEPLPAIGDGHYIVAIEHHAGEGAKRFSWWFTSPMHRFPDAAGFGQKVREAELDYLIHSEAASRSLAENYVGLPPDFAEP
jgi:hypothetical protein